MMNEIEEEINTESIEISSIKEYEKLEEIKKLDLDIEPTRSLIEKYGKYIGQTVRIQKIHESSVEIGIAKKKGRIPLLTKEIVDKMLKNMDKNKKNKMKVID